MNARVFVMRRRGRRLKVRGGEGLPGKLSIHSVTHGSALHQVATLTETEERGSKSRDVIPPLHEPQLVAIGQESILLRGFEAEDETGYVQEWMCVFA
ncbi:hypothetical protein BWI17_01870 [Betaproteobacteria bacterium GR16-43]|nr:hypothetical protein BWI17_01870 [Betaproteobacteria bacterium GR16-43]